MKHKTSHTRILLPVLLLTAAAGVQAAGPDNALPKHPVLDDARDNLREIRDLENQRREDAAWSLQKSQSENAAEAEPPQDTQADKAAVGEDTCLNYQNIELTGIKHINIAKIRNKLPKCVSERSLNQLSKDIVAAYIEKGYPHTQIDFEEKDGTLALKVTEGRIREITGGSRTVNINTLFPNHKNKPLNIKHLDQGLEQANKLSGNSVSMDIYPHEDGSATVALQNQAGKNWFGSLTVDNKGSSQYPAVARAQVGIDSPLGLSDSLYLSGHTNIRHGDGYYSRGGNAFYSVPYGMWTFSGYLGQSRSQSVTKFATVSLAYRSRTDSAGIKAERVLSRGQKHIVSAHLGFDHLRARADYGGSRLALQSPRLSTVQAGVSHSKMLSNGVWINTLGVETGTRLLGAKDKPASPFTSQYRLYSLQSDLSQSRRAGKWLIRNQHRLSAQYSKDELYGTKQFSISDRSAVRGFKKLSLNGKSGAAVNNTLFFRRYSESGMFMEPYFGADAGVAKDGSNRYRGTGIAAGINVGYKSRWQFAVESARGFYKGKDGSKAREEQITASFRVSF